MPAITTNGVTLYYEAYGKLSDGGTVFLIPGLGMQHWMWPDTLIETLVKGGAGVVVMDNRDCGRSSRCSGRVSMGRVFSSIGRTLTRRPVSGVYGLEEMASDVVGLASGLGIRTFHAAGISMGGMIAQVLAARYPESVLSLTSMSSATGNPRTGLGKFSAIWATIRPQSRLASESEGVKRLDRFIRAMGSVSYERTDAEKRRLVRLMARNPGDRMDSDGNFSRCYRAATGALRSRESARRRLSFTVSPISSFRPARAKKRRTSFPGPALR